MDLHLTGPAAHLGSSGGIGATMPYRERDALVVVSCSSLSWADQCCGRWHVCLGEAIHSTLCSLNQCRRVLGQVTSESNGTDQVRVRMKIFYASTWKVSANQRP